MLIAPCCPLCNQSISTDHSIAFQDGQIVHIDCERPRALSPEERQLLFKYCFNHTVAQCSRCVQDFRQTELASDMFGNREHLCPRCRADLTEQLREHLYNCSRLPGDLRRSAREVRAATQRLVNPPEMGERADVLVREAELAIAALREAMQRISG